MTARRLLLPAAVAAALVLTGCSGSLDPTPEQTAAAEQSGQDVTDLRAALAQVDPALDTQEAGDAADQVCVEIQEGQDDAAVESTARDAFGGLSDAELSDEQVAEIVEAVKTHFCR
ncbi:MAG TPA: hypothetical protein VIL55_06660 [Naasia sp.]|jgi:outer membrane murein-binding lipoprotein Lpp